VVLCQSLLGQRSCAMQLQKAMFKLSGSWSSALAYRSLKPNSVADILIAPKVKIGYKNVLFIAMKADIDYESCI
jgi:hypothetical protein